MREGEKEIFQINLHSDVQENLDVKLSPNKAEITLKKKIPGKWADICGDKMERTPELKKFCTKQWDKLAKEVDEDPECSGEEGVNKFFKQIYENLDEDGKKAMMKSMQESGGTVLSTNWKEVSKNKVDVKPPDGMEFKKY